MFVCSLVGLSRSPPDRHAKRCKVRTGETSRGNAQTAGGLPDSSGRFDFALHSKEGGGFLVSGRYICNPLSIGFTRTGNFEAGGGVGVDVLDLISYFSLFTVDCII